MQISKILLAVCTVMGCVGSLSFAGQDSPSQIQAREALRQKIAELNAQESQTPAPQATKKKKAAPAPAPQPVVQPPPVVVAPPPAVATPAPVVTTTPPAASASRMTSEQAAQLREALRQKMAELDAQEKTGQPTFAPVTSTSQAKSAAVIKAEQKAAAAEAKRQAEEAKAQERAAAEAPKRAAAAEKQRWEDESKAKSAKPNPVTVTKANAAAFAPVEPPPSAVPASKDAKLADLLRKYKADAITPEEYHKERAKVLAEP